jgi:hypothetical protein
MAGKVTRKRAVNPEKLKDMIESILPCKARHRKTAYFFKRMERRRVRHLVNLNLRTCDGEGYTDKDLMLKPYQSENVWQRRSADKINHFMRWGDRLTEGMPEEEALAYIRKLLPRSVIGDHAYSHWEIQVKRKFYLRNRTTLKLVIKNEGGSPEATSSFCWRMLKLFYQSATH